MHRLLKTLFLLPWLSACVPSFFPGGMSPEQGGAPLMGLSHDFNWRLSGDRRVAPVQVFDDGRQTWLQFAPGQALPAIFVEHNGIEQPATYTRREPYVIVSGKWRALVMRGGSLLARADYLGAGQQTPAGSAGFAPAASGPTSAPLASASASAPVPVPAPAPASGSASAPFAPTSAIAPARASAAVSATLFRVGLADENMRRALARWAGLAGWTFQPEHWAVDVDIPLSANADFSDDFKRSVRALLATTELGERPLQPCFYANQVLRVVPVSQACDRTAIRAGAPS